MRKIIVTIFLINVCFFAQAQISGILQTIEIEISGRPTWQKIIPLGKNGVLLFAKKDITKALAIRFDTNLKKVWETEVFLDVEGEPSFYSLDNKFVTFMFSENQGMYYQLFRIDLDDGKFENMGFELREYFQDQNYIYFDNQILMAGLNENGASFYKYNFKADVGELISAGLRGKTKVQYFKYLPEKNIIESLWSVKVLGYTNEKKKKGEFIKDAFVVFAKYDTTGKLIQKNIIHSSAGNFPLTASLTKIDSVTKIITGTYQSNTGNKGLFFSKIDADKTTLTKFYDYRILLKGTPNIDDEIVKKIANSHIFSPSEVSIDNNVISLGGTFYKSIYQVVSSSSPFYNNSNPYTANNPLFLNANFNNPHSQSKQVFKGYSYLNGLVANFDLEGNLMSQSRVDLSQLSPQLDVALAISSNKSVVTCVKGNLLIGNNLGFTNAKTFKLSDEEGDVKNAQYIPTYQGVRNWYENYFIANGSRIKFEVLKDKNAPKEKPSKRKKGQQQLPETNIKKIIYLSKVRSSEFY